MAAVTFTGIRPASTSTEVQMLSCGTTISAGQVVYRDSTDSNKAKLADNNGSAATATVSGIALHAGVSGGGWSSFLAVQLFLSVQL